MFSNNVIVVIIMITNNNNAKTILVDGTGRSDFVGAPSPPVSRLRLVAHTCLADRPH